MTPQQALLTLSLIPHLGPLRIRRLLDTFASPEIILHAPAATLSQVSGISSELALRIASWASITNTERECELAAQAGASITTILDEDYPDALRILPGAPVILYAWGAWQSHDGAKSLAVVGPRKPSHYGLMTAKTWSYELAETGVTIISGLARGIDTEAHKAALDARGRTLAIIGSGLNKLYPQENLPLARRIAEEGGAVISEFPMNMEPSTTTFPMRNRIVAAWSSATLVVEAAAKSGALITANLANELGKQVFAIPGAVDRPHSIGCHNLIRDGATLAANINHIMDDMGWRTHQQSDLPLFAALQPSAASTPTLTDDEKAVLNAIRQGCRTLDTIASSSGLPISTITGSLAKLQIHRLITSVAGGEFAVI